MRDDSIGEALVNSSVHDLPQRAVRPPAARPQLAHDGAWAESTRPGEADTASSALPSSSFDLPRQVPDTARAAFDVCHVGVVLRAVLAVQAVVAIGVAFVATSAEHWLVLFATGAGIALAGTLLWLMAACALQGVLARASDAVQWSVAIALGAASAMLCWGLLVLSGIAVDNALPHWLPAAVAGAAMAAALALWLRLRARLAQPADASARLAELQSRIRPHFLFNTLNTAIALVRVDPRRAEDVLADLAELFRVALLPRDEAVTLADEIELARRYLAIEQVRFGSRLVVQWELDGEAGRARVPPLLLQPLVENAVRHGIEPAPDGGTIRVRTRVRRGHALLSVVNTVSAEPSAPGHGLALRNVRERLHLMHDVAAQLDARRDGDVFRVQIVLPLESAR